MGGARALRRIALVALTTIVTFSPPTEAAPLHHDRILRQPELMRELAAMVALSESTAEEDEIAAFLVRRGRHYALVPWPRINNNRSETWRGPLPEGTIAIVHTHPNGWSRPSAADHREATRTGLPFFVLTRWDIWLAVPGERRGLRLLKNVHWTEDTWLASLETGREQETSRVATAIEPEPLIVKEEPAVKETTRMK